MREKHCSLAACWSSATEQDDNFFHTSSYICQPWIYYTCIYLTWQLQKHHYRKQWLCRVPQALSKDKKHSAKALPSITLDKQHTTSTVSTNSYLPSVFYHALDKWFAECQIWHSAKKVVCRVFFQNTLGKGLLFAECFWNYTRQTYFPKKKNNFFLSIFQFNSCYTKHS